MATAGQPTKYNAEALATAQDYVKNYADYEDIVPSVVGLAVALDVTKKTLYNWAESPENIEFLHTLEKISSNQERRLLNGGLSKSFDAGITKLMLYNHGYTGQPKEPDDSDEAPPLQISFNVKEPVTEIKVTNAKS